MRGPDPATLLAAWERALQLPLQRRAVALLAAACPEVDEADIAAWPVGRRDAALLDLREALFGAELVTVAACPQCGAQLEAQFPTAALRPTQAAGDGSDGTLTVESEGHRIAFRPPSSADLLAIPDQCDPAAASALLLDSCVEAVDAAGHPVAGHVLPEAARAKVIDGMAAADPFAVVELDLTCADCGHAFAALFDIAAFLLREVQAWARRMLRDVDTLARVYGWRESDVLALSPLRRQLYVGMARS